MGAAEDVAAIIADPNEPFETEDALVAATYSHFAAEMTDEPLLELWQEAIEAVRGADHDAAEAALAAIETAIEAARERLLTVENGTAWKRGA